MTTARGRFEGNVIVQGMGIFFETPTNLDYGRA